MSQNDNDLDKFVDQIKGRIRTILRKNVQELKSLYEEGASTDDVMCWVVDEWTRIETELQLNFKLLLRKWGQKQTESLIEDNLEKTALLQSLKESAQF